ncbi:MAG: preprotein translocase subunit SecA [Candidatus Pacebacteria bacterium]|nr:preprotein translocase subunit SecA [Candidatus Paceibacterota bacterium]
MKLFKKLLGDPNEKIIKTLEPIIKEIDAKEEDMRALSSEGLKEKTESLKKKLQQGKTLDDILPEAFALVREASSRVLGLRHYKVQLIGGIILHRGQIAEMKTGEGKTLVATLPLFLNALSGKGAHLITVNDYLSRVGAGWMGPVYDALGLSVSVIVHDGAFLYDRDYSDSDAFDKRLEHFRPISRQEAYKTDITYGTNNEFGFDYLRDNMVGSLKDVVQRSFSYCIVDEIDSILIDEARTPLIISVPAEESTDKYFKFAQLVQKLEENKDYNLDEKMKSATLSEEGMSKMEKWLGVDNIYVSGGIKEVHHIEQALKARVLFKKDRDYVIKDGEIIIVDEFTGRLMPGRRYSEGLHQAIEAKEGLEVKRESQTLATVTFQNYFRMYEKLSGMTGTALTEAEEFFKIYNLETVAIPTHRPVVRKDYSDLIFRTELGKFKAVIKDVKEKNAKGQPILIGTISIEKNEFLVSLMEQEGLSPQVLNAKNHAKEAQIIAEAGQKGAITIATNMAGRGVDIVLGGPDSDKQAQEEIKALGGLHVIGTERHEARRIDNQLRGRSGRQGDPGSSQFYVSAEDDLLRIFGGDRMKMLMSRLRLPEATPIQNSLVSKSLESAQKKVEGNNFDMRKHLVEYDDVINKHRETIYKRRREILESYESSEHKQEVLTERILTLVFREVEDTVSFHTISENLKDWNLQEVYETTKTIFSVSETLLSDLEKLKNDSTKKKEDLRRAIIEKIQDLAKASYLSLKNSFQEININFAEVEKGILIRSIDNLWVEHLETINYLRQGIGLRGYGQRDPLVEYKKEAFRLFQELENLIQKQVVYSIYKTAVAIQTQSQQFFSAPSLADRAKNFQAPAKTMENNSVGGFKVASAKVKNEEGEKVGRNDPCPCGSGKKYKKCCGK